MLQDKDGALSLLSKIYRINWRFIAVWLLGAKVFPATAAQLPLFKHAPATAATAQKPQTGLPRMTLWLGRRNIPLSVQVAQSEVERNLGLMYRDFMPENEGMLFRFDTAQKLCFWMKNTHLPLSLAYLDTQGRVVALMDMQPYTLTPHCAPVPAAYAVEVNQGWFKRHHIRVGDVVRPLRERFAEGD